MDEKELQEKMERFMYALIKRACQWSFLEFLEDIDLTDGDYEEIKKALKEKMGITRFYV